MHLDYEFNMNKQIWESTMVDISLYFLIVINYLMEMTLKIV